MTQDSLGVVFRQIQSRFLEVFGTYVGSIVRPAENLVNFPPLCLTFPGAIGDFAATRTQTVVAQHFFLFHAVTAFAQLQILRWLDVLLGISQELVNFGVT